MKKFNILIMSVAMLIAGLNFYFANCDAQTDLDLSMTDVEQVAQGEIVNGIHVGETKSGETPEGDNCGTCGFYNNWCKSCGNQQCTPQICAHYWAKLEKKGLVPKM